MDINEATKRVRAAGYAGVGVWNVGAGWNGWLIKPDALPAQDTVLWHRVDTAEEALTLLVAKAEKYTYN